MSLTATSLPELRADTALLGRAMLDVGVRPGKRVLTLGTDAGMVATAAAATGADATCVDVCLEAAAAACESACLRGIRVHLRYGRIPDSTTVGRFDLIVANLPVRRGHS